jgi:DNA-binding CsgD family transcriptional regulator
VSVALHHRDADVIVLGAAQRRRLKRLARSTAVAHRLVLRAQIVLHAAGGARNATIAAKLGIHLDTVRRWRHRFATENRESGEERSVIAMLDDRPRSGRPRIYGPHERVKSWRR